MKKFMLPIAMVLLLAAACNSGKNPQEMTPEEETQFVTEEANAIDSSVTQVSNDVKKTETQVDSLLKGI